ncbi:MAG: hypothetical protein WCI66_09125 [Gammaproteobacteria bacterium]|jgi:hypothetical protein
MKLSLILRRSALHLVAALVVVPALSQAALYISIVQGLGGQPLYDEQFVEARKIIEASSNTITDADKVFSFSGERATRAALLKHFTELGKKMAPGDRAAIYLIGHGSFDGETYKFNIPGPDLTAQDLKSILEHLPGRNHFLVNTSSTSGAMLETLVGKGDKASNPAFVVISATRNGNERNATQFGRYFAEALRNKDADLNKNNNISIQEAFDYAEKQVSTHFQDESKLATEHAQLRGDGAALFNLARLNASEQKAELASASGKLVELLKKRKDLEAQIEDLQVRRSQLNNTDYLARFQQLILQSAEVSEQIEAAQKANGPIKPVIEADPALPKPPGGTRVP